MNIGNLSDDEMQKVFLSYCLKLMLKAKENGGSMAILEIDPKVVFGLPIDASKANAGLLTVAVAGGPSRAKLKQAVDLVQSEH